MTAVDLACARCGSRMHARAVGELTLHGCGGCGGVWMDNAASQQLASGELSPHAVELARRVADFAATHASPEGGYRAAPPAPSARPTCPRCASPLQHAEVTGVALDVCAAHGTWFDPGELGAVYGHFAAKRAADEAAGEVLREDLEQARRRELAESLLDFLIYQL